MPSRRPNILMIAVDSLRRDHLSCYGYPRLTSPHLDRLAQRGVLFENAFSAYIPTTPGYSTMLTGRDVIATGQVGLQPLAPLDPTQPTLPEILRDHDYVSACIGFDGDWYRGFDYYDTFAAWMSWEDRPARKAENMNEKALPMMEKMNKSGQPWLLFLRHMDPHSPYLAPPPFDKLFYSGDPCDRKLPNTMKPVFDFKPFATFFKSWMPPGVRDISYIVAQYDSELAYMDACIARLFQHLTELGVAENTLIVLTSDHGETLDEHDCYFDHHGMYEPTLRIPMVFSWPGVLPQGLRVPGYALLEDLVPTLVDMLKLTKARKVPVDGRSLVPMMQGKVKEYRSEFYTTECTWMRKRGWRTREWKLIEALEPDFHGKPPVELYNLITDPLELKNVAEKELDVVELLRQRMYTWLEKRMKQTGKPDPILAYHLGLGKSIGSIATAQSLQKR